MKTLKLFLVVSVVIPFFCYGNDGNPFSGKWYANQYGCRTDVTFNPDSTVSIHSEANGNANITAPYSIKNDSIEDRYLLDINMGLVCKGIAIVEEPSHMQIAITFDPGMSRPEKIEDIAQSAYGMALDLHRDSTLVRSALDNIIEAPTKANLAFERNKRLGTGVNLNGYVDANPFDGNDAPMTEQDFRDLAKAGYESVRIPTAWVKHASKEAPYTIDEDFFKKIDWTIEQCLQNNIAVSLDQHYYPYINMNYDDPDLTWEQNLERIKSFWAQIAERYKDLPNDMVFFDLLNEPNMMLGADGLNKLHAELIEIIRKTNPDRTLLIETPNLGQTWTLGELEFPEDEWNIIVQAHCYTPYMFTHQNLEYIPSTMTGIQMPWNGSKEEREVLENDMNFCKRWSDINKRPINIGEYGVCINADTNSRNLYLDYIQSLFKEFGFSSHRWSYRGAFK